MKRIFDSVVYVTTLILDLTNTTFYEMKKHIYSYVPEACRVIVIQIIELVVKRRGTQSVASPHATVKQQLRGRTK